MRDRELHLRIIVKDPPPGVDWALQLGREELVRPSARSSGLAFEAVVRVVATRDGDLDLRGPAVQGPRNGRFVYLNSGKRAGQAASCWDRRAKVSLEGLRTLLAQGVTEDASLMAEVGIVGTGRDGGPACASVPLTGTGWRLRAPGGAG
jgi:Family of unknown function (DUF5990)